MIDACEHHWNRPGRADGIRRMLGVATVLLLLALSAGGAWLFTLAAIANQA